MLGKSGQQEGPRPGLGVGRKSPTQERVGSRGPSPSPSQTPHWLLRVSCLHLIPAEDVAARGLFLRNRTCCSPVHNPSMAAHCLLGTVRSQSEKPNPAVGGFAGLSPESADVWKAVSRGRWWQLRRSEESLCAHYLCKLWTNQTAKHGKGEPQIGGQLKSKSGQVGNVEKVQTGVVTGWSCVISSDVSGTP